MEGVVSNLPDLLFLQLFDEPFHLSVLEQPAQTRSRPPADDHARATALFIALHGAVALGGHALAVEFVGNVRQPLPRPRPAEDLHDPHMFLRVFLQPVLVKRPVGTGRQP